MRLIREIVTTQAYGDPAEIDDLRTVLTVGTGDEAVCLLSPDQTFFSGLVEFIRPKWTALDREPFEVQDMDTSPTLAIEDIDFNKYPLPNEVTVPFDHQLMSVRKALVAKRGVLNLATGSGKSLMGAMFAHYLLSTGTCKRALIVVGGIHLLNQAYKDYTGTDPGEAGISVWDVGRVGSGYAEFGKKITIAISTSLYSGIKSHDQEIMDLLSDCDCVVFDEVAHLKSASWTAIGSHSNAPFRLGLDALAYEEEAELEDGELRLIGLTGPILVRLPASWLWRRGFLAEPHLTVIKVPSVPFKGVWDWHKVYKRGIVEDEDLNELICDLANMCYEFDLHVLILTQTHEHAFSLLSKLSKKHQIPAIMMTGGEQAHFYDPNGLTNQTMPITEYRAYVEGRPASVTVATPVFDEGINIPKMDVLIPSGGIKKHRKLIQRAGRIMRAKKDAPYGNRCFLFELYTASHPFLESQSKKRLKFYEKQEIEVNWGFESLSRLLGPISLSRSKK